MPLQPTVEELEQRDRVIAVILDCIRTETVIKLPDFEPGQGSRMPDNAFGGLVAGFSYQFEGEEDLLHLYVTKADGTELTPEEARPVVGFLLPNVAPGLVWLKPGSYSQHFYLGHDELLR